MENLSRRVGPDREQLDYPGNLDPATLVFVLERLAAIAIDFELEPLQSTVELSRPQSITDFIVELESKIADSPREQAAKGAALDIIAALTSELRGALEGLDA